MGAFEVIALAARVAQAIFSIIVLGCAAYVVSQYNSDTFDGLANNSYPQANFMIFVSLWSLLIVGYQIAVPRFSEKLGHKFVILGLDGITTLFWFAGFIALSVSSRFWQDVANAGLFTGTGLQWFHTLQAACAFGAFAWVSFMITTVLSLINVFRGNTGSAKAHHDMGIAHNGV